MYKWIALCTLLVFLLGGFAASQAHGIETSQSAGDLTNIDSRHLKITAIPDDEVGFTVIPLAEQEKTVIKEITYLHVTDVQINIAGRSKKLETAILDGDITIPELICYARMDALEGVCREIASSHNGLAYFTYRYPEYDIKTCHDIYETPDGKQHKMDYFGVYRVGSKTSFGYEDDSGPVGYFIDREDWGITLDVATASSEGIVLVCDQQQGQQVGKLVAIRYMLFSGRSDGDLQLIESNDLLNDEMEVRIFEDERSEISINWKNSHGLLSGGEYCLRLYIEDQYEPEDLHPLMRKYHDIQAYWIDFTIP